MGVEVHNPRGHPGSVSIDHLQVHALRLELLEQGNRNITDDLDETAVHKQVASENLIPVISSCPDSRITEENRLRVLMIAVALCASMEMEWRPGLGASVGAFGEDLRATGKLVWVLGESGKDEG